MPAPIRKYDALGFPIPATFEDLPNVGSDTSRSVIEPRKTRLTIRRKRIFAAVIVIVVAAYAFGPFLKGIGKDAMIAWNARQAQQKFQSGDYRGATNNLTAAIAWGSEHPDLYYTRAIARLKIDDLQGSLEDLTYSTLHPPRLASISQVYSQRAWVHIRLGNKQQAVDDANRSIDLGSAHDPSALNQRAYIRALANLNETDLRAGLKDIDRALEMVGEGNPEYLDTRAYLRHLLGQNETALEDMNAAIPLIEQQRSLMGRESDVHEFNHSLAVMYYHRSLIYRALKQDSQADADAHRVEQLGFEPKPGLM